MKTETKRDPTQRRTTQELVTEPPFDIENRPGFTVKELLDLDRALEGTTHLFASLNDAGREPSNQHRQLAARIAANLETIAAPIPYTVAPDDLDVAGVGSQIRVIAQALMSAVGIDPAPYPVPSFGEVVDHCELCVQGLRYRIQVGLEYRVREGSPASVAAER